ncbi:hypothetical protein X274_07730 [Marinitoga sp. 1155]|nr:hypothetical protein X274_07730 [Marinitoga sp. 1155]
MEKFHCEKVKFLIYQVINKYKVKIFLIFKNHKKFIKISDKILMWNIFI